MTYNAWDRDQIAKLKELADEGKSAAQIALDLGTTRNAVIGKARRIGAKLRAKPPQRAALPGKERGILGTGVRKAFASKGDDATLARFVKTGARKRHYQLLLLESERAPSPKLVNRAAVQEGRTIFRKSVKNLSQVDNLLVSGHNNVKIGRDVRAPARLFRGYWIYTLSFEERATCPHTCYHWETCYGNNMPYAKRVDHRDFQRLVDRLQGEVEKLLGQRGRIGILVRLHALGDFFSVDYVRFWGIMLALHDRLAIFGYTAHAPDSDIGRDIANLKDIYGERFAIRWSNGGLEQDCTVPVQPGTQRVENAFICPEQMNLADAKGRAVLCATCGLCWSTTKNVAFMEH